MSIVRNYIDIVGITPESELPNKVNGQYIEVSETENLIIDSSLQIENIYKIIVDAGIEGTRVINTPRNKIIVIDGHKKFKIAYYDIENNMGILELNSPYNLFFDIENNNVEVENIDLYIADAYFELVNSRILYCYIIYIAYIEYSVNGTRIDKVSDSNRYLKGKCNIELYTIGSDSKNDMFKAVAINEMSIAEDKKNEFEEDIKLYTKPKNKLIDLETEYL